MWSPSSNLPSDTDINGLSYSRIIIGTKNKIIALVSGRPGRRLDAEEAR